MAATPATPEPRVRLGRRYALTIVGVVAGWLALVAVLVYFAISRSGWVRQSDQANLREWLDESRVFRKTIPDLAAEYVSLRDSGLPGDHPDVTAKAEEIEEQLQVLADSTRLYQGYLPLFPDLYRLEVAFPGSDWPSVAWVSPVPPPRQQNQSSVDVLEYEPANKVADRVRIRCEYRLHAFNQRQREAAERQTQQLLAAGLGVLLILPVAGLAYWSLQRERKRELRRLMAEQQVEHATNLVLQEKLARQDAEREREEAERGALELKSQLYASIGIMAGSYAHNIKNLLVRPNDLISRCLEADGLSPVQESMLGEVRQTLGTVTERLQQILRTIRRDPNKAEMTRLDLNDLVRETLRTWQDLAREKWKLTLAATVATEPLWIDGDLSHLQQAVENLLFNARDATFEMRNRRRDDARRAAEPARRQALIDAAGWKGRIELRTFRDGDRCVLEVSDNGIGMSAEVAARCTQTHFSTKRDNALYEGYSAGMGLGLSFTAVVLEHHGAAMTIESQPLTGATFRVSFPNAGDLTS